MNPTGLWRIRSLFRASWNIAGRLERGRGGEGQERGREEGEESARQLEEVDQGNANASEDSEQVFGKRDEMKTH